MDKRRIEELAEDPRFVPGIYNYCDRWCERCTFTSRCMTYALESDEHDDPESQDIGNKAFWDKLHGVFEVAMEMVRERAQEMGVDLDAADLDEIARQQEELHQAARRQPCSQAATRYATLVKEWFDSNKGLLEEKSTELQSLALAGIPNADPGKEALGIRDCLEVVRWYQHQIAVKLCRAATGMIRGDLEDLEHAAHDAAGSAKVAIIGIERSMEAWAGLLSHFPDQEQPILHLLVTLKHLLRRVETTFPTARAFVRPGFDTEG
jgi:hypothetical protein